MGSQAVHAADLAGSWRKLTDLESTLPKRSGELIGPLMDRKLDLCVKRRRSWPRIGHFCGL